MLNASDTEFWHKNTTSKMIGRPSSFEKPNYVNVLFASNDRSIVVDSIKGKDELNKLSICEEGHAHSGKTVRRENKITKSKMSKSSACIKVDLDKYLRPDFDDSKQYAKPSGVRRKGKNSMKKKTGQLTPDINGQDNLKSKRAGIPENGFRSKSVEDALQVIERRKKSIRAKLMMKKEHLLTQEEEQDIHTRADLYAITAVPDVRYCISTEKDSVRKPPTWCCNDHDETFSPPRKKRRRNYGNTNCYVTYHNDDDIFDNTKMLPIGTRLVKPPTKLVELVAQAISGSPDGLLQVQQIYTCLQNKYPFFRYMDRIAINSWRSSIRHALYQKWFRKIRFDLSFISSKGCYWAINNKNNPKEWSLPQNRCLTSVGKQICTENFKDSPEIPELQEVADIAEQLLSSDSEKDSVDTDQIDASVSLENTEPGLNTADWHCEEMFLSSAESGHGTMSPDVSPSFQQLVDMNNNKSDKYVHRGILTTPVKHENNPKDQLKISSPKMKYGQSQSTAVKSEISPLVHWIPDWEEYGSYIISPQNIATQKYVLGLPIQINSDLNRTESDADRSNGLNVKTEFSLMAGQDDSLIKFCSDTSDSSSCDFEIIAEYTRSGTGSPDLMLGSL